MSERIISFRLNSETANLYDEYRRKYVPELVSDSQLIRAGLSVMMAMPDAADQEEMDKLAKENDQIRAEMNEILKQHPEPRLHEQWVKLLENTDKIAAVYEKSAEKYSNFIGEGKKGRKPNPFKKHTPGRLPDSEKDYTSKL